MFDLIFNKPFLLFANCVIVKGYKRSSILDLHKQEYHLIPNSLADIIKRHEGKTINDIKLIYYESVNVIDEYFSYLKKLGLIFFTSNPEQFPRIELVYETPSLINNAIVEYAKQTDYKYIANILNELSCKAISCFLDFDINYSDILKILSSFNSSCIKHIDIHIRRHYEKDVLTELFIQEERLQQIVVFNSSVNENHPLTNGLGREIIYSTMDFDFTNQTPLNQFSINQQTFLESQKHHTYFNKKLFLGVNGDIKNAPTCKETFGNLYELYSIQNIINSKDFQRYWFVNKDSCDVCSSCEFRYMCVDNRIPIRRKDGSWFHESECNYNPYICKSKGEPGYISLAACGITSNLKSFSLDEVKIKEVNEEAWG